MSAPIEVTALIDGRRIGRFHVLLLALCAIVMVLDGFDTQAIGYVAPAIIRAWHVERTMLTPVFRDGLLGGVVGAVVFGLLADRFGRKTILLLCTLCFGVFSLATMTAQSLDELRLWRFLTGLGLGGGLPNAVAMISDYAPRRLRATMVTLTLCGFAVGGAVGGLVAAWLLGRFGWAAVFAVGGVLPLLFVPVMILMLPDSLRHLVSRRPPEHIARVMARLDPRLALPTGARFVLREELTPSSPLRQLWMDRRALATAMIWTAYFTNLICLYFLSNWLPTLINGTGIPVEEAAIVTAMLQVGGITSTLLLGRVIDRLGHAAVLATIFALAALFMAALGLVPSEVLIIGAVVFAAGFCIIGGQIGLNALAAATYPSSIRSTGIGSALAVGRLGSVAGPVIGGALLAAGADLRSLFLIAALPALIAALAMLMIRWARQPAGAPALPPLEETPS